MHILISGATGLVGQVLVEKLLKKNYHVAVLTQNFFKTKLIFSENVEVYTYHPEVQKKKFDAIINLAGEPISQIWWPWTKKKILESRINTTRFLCQISAKHLISTSAIGLYPFSYSLQNEETKPVQNHFLAQVCCAWEEEAKKFLEKLTIVRVPLVLSSQGGIIEKLKPLFEWFLGAYLGSGKQGVSWIHVEDLAEVYIFLLEKNLAGIYNAVAGQNTHQEFYSTFASLLERSIFLKVPEIFLKLFMGDFSHLFLDSHFIDNQKLKKEKFTFKHKDLHKTLFECLKDFKGS